LTLGTAANSYIRDWDKEFQDALACLDSNEMRKGYAGLAAVSRDFHDQAKATMMLIISELGIVEEQKTHMSLHSGDALVTTYDVLNIIYQVAHGGQASQSWKDLGNELRHSLNLFRCRPPGIAIPLMCLFDYKGFRVLCYAKLPKAEKLVLGWDTALKGYISEYAELHSILAPAAKSLNLKGHKIGTGELALPTWLSASSQCFMAKQSQVEKVNNVKPVVYISNLRDLFPTDLTRGGTVNPEELHDDVHSESPFKLRPELVRRSNTPLAADIGIGPVKTKFPTMYEHEGADANLIEVRRVSRNLLKLVTFESVEKLTKLLDSMPSDPSSETIAAKCKAVTSQLQAEGMNLRLLGHMRKTISPDSQEDTQRELRHIILTEMVARVLKVSFHKVLREANGFMDSNKSLADVVAAQLGGEVERDEELPYMDAGPKREPSNEACRAAIVRFLNVALSRPYIPPVAPPIRNKLIDTGMDSHKVEEVLSLSKMIAEMKAYNRKHHPSGADAALAELKKELVMIVKAAVPGGEKALEKIAQRKIAQEAAKQQRELIAEEKEKQMAQVILEEPLPMDPFSVYWRETMRGLILKKYGVQSMSKEEQQTDWILLEHIDTKAVLLRVQDMTGVQLSQEGFKRLEFMADKPTHPGAAVRWVDTDVISLGPRQKDLGVTLASKGWELIYIARSMAKGQAKLNILKQAQDCFHSLLKATPNDWIACYDYGCSVYEQAWSGPTTERYDKLRLAYKHLRHSHQIAPSFEPAMLRMGDAIYAMTIMRQDAAIEEDYVSLCVAASAMLDASQDYANRCEVWAEQILAAAKQTGGYRSQRLYTLSGVTYNEWIGLGASDEAADLSWIIQHHSELAMEPADIGVMVELVRMGQSKGGKKGLNKIEFTNNYITDACLRLMSNKVPQGNLKKMDTSNLALVTAEAVMGVLEEHGEWVEELALTCSQKITIPDLAKCISLCYAEGFGQLRDLELVKLHHLKDETLHNLAPRIPTTLTALSLRDNYQMTGQGVCEVARTHTGLLKLDISGCERFTDACMLVTTQRSRLLETLVCEACPLVGDAALLEMAYRTRRFFDGEEGVLSSPIMNHDDPMLHIIDLVLKTQGKLKIRQKQAADEGEDEQFVFDEGVTGSDDPEAMRAFEEEQRRKAVIQNMKAKEEDKELDDALAKTGDAIEQTGLIAPPGAGKLATLRRTQSKGGPTAMIEGGKKVDLDALAIKLGLEEPAQREKRLRAEEKAADAVKDEEDKVRMWEEFKLNKTPYQIARELNVDIRKVMEQQDRYNLQNTVFEKFLDTKQEDLFKYAIIVNVTEVKMKKKLIQDLNPSSRTFIRVALTTGGTVKNSGFKSVVTEMDFQWSSFIPRVQDLACKVKFDFMEKPDSGPPKSWGYYKADLPKFIDYPVEYMACPFYGVSGFHTGQPVGRILLSVRAVSPKVFDLWKESMATYDSSNLVKANQKMSKANTEKSQVVTDKVVERVLEWVLTQSVDAFAKFKTVREVNVAYCPNITDYSVIEVCRSMPLITTLNISGCHLVTDKALSFIARLCPVLSSLRMDTCMQITDDGMVEVASGCLGLQKVSFNDCKNLGDATISFLINFDVDHRLKELSYQGLPRTTEESFSQIANACTSLERLSVSGSALYRDVQVLHLASRCKKLTHLDLTWCEKLTDLGIGHLAKGCAQLQELSLAYCEGVGTQGVVAIAENCPAMHTLDLTGLIKLRDPAILVVMRALLQLSALRISLCENLTRESLAAINDWGEGMTSLEMLGCSSMGRKHVVRFKEQVRGRMQVMDEKDDEISAFDSLYH